MTSVYLDSSVLVKRYVKEPGSREVNRLFSEGTILLVSSIAWSECLAALSRKRHDGGLSVRSHGRATQAFATEWKSFHEIAITREIRELIRELLDRLPLRGMDAIHLASALWIERRLDSKLPFYCADRKLAKAGEELGLTVVSPGNK